MTEIVILIPVLGRPHRVEPLLASLAASQGEIPLRPFFLASVSDEPQLAALRGSDADFAVVRWPPGRADWARKINAGYRLTEEPWMLLGADDLEFRPGWAEAALAIAERTGARVVGTWDGGNRQVMSGVFSTHPLVARSYVDEGLAVMDDTGEVVSQAYDHNWPDRELAETAKMRGEWAFARSAQVIHRHPHWREGLPMDATYEKGLRRFAEDAQTYRERSGLWTRRQARTSAARGRVRS